MYKSAYPPAVDDVLIQNLLDPDSWAVKRLDAIGNSAHYKAWGRRYKAVSDRLREATFGELWPFRGVTYDYDFPT